MTQETDDTTELADRHDGAEVSRSQIQATVQYEVELTDEQIDKLPENMSPAEFAENCATSRATNALDVRMPQNAIAQETGRYDENVYTVVVTVS